MRRIYVYRTASSVGSFVSFYSAHTSTLSSCSFLVLLFVISFSFLSCWLCFACCFSEYTHMYYCFSVLLFFLLSNVWMYVFPLNSQFSTYLLSLWISSSAMHTTLSLSLFHSHKHAHTRTITLIFSYSFIYLLLCSVFLSSGFTIYTTWKNDNNEAKEREYKQQNEDPKKKCALDKFMGLCWNVSSSPSYA